MSWGKRLAILTLLLVVALPLLLLTLIVAITQSEQGSRWLAQQALQYSPYEVTIARWQGDFWGPLQLDQVSVKDAGEPLLTVKQFYFNWQPLALLSGSLDITALNLAGVDLHLPVSDEPPKSNAESISLPDISSPLMVNVEQIQIDDLAIYQQQQTLFDLRRLHLSAQFQQQLAIDQFELEHDLASVTIAGKLTPNGRYPHQLQLQWHLHDKSLPELNGKVELAGDIQQSNLSVKSDGAAQAQLQAALQDLLGELQWHAQLHLPEQRLDAISEALSEYPLALDLTMNGDLKAAEGKLQVDAKTPFSEPLTLTSELQLNQQQLQLEQLQIIHQRQQPERLQGQVTLQQWLTQPELQAQLNWSTITLQPLTGELSEQQPASVVSENGQLQLRGPLQQLQILLSQQLLAFSDELDNELNATLFADHIDIKQLSLADQYARLAINGELNWQSQLTTDLTIQGQVEQRPIDGAIKLTLSDNNLNIEALTLKSGNNDLNAQGDLQKTGVQLHLALNDLSQLMPDWQGQINGQIDARGELSALTAKAKLNLAQLSLLDTQLTEAQLNADWQGLANSNQLQVTAKQLSYADQQLDTLTLDASGNADAHQLDLSLTGWQSELQIQLSGTWQAQQWQGQLRQLDSRLLHTGDWQLQQPVDIDVALSTATTAIEMTPLCLNNKELTQPLCLQSDLKNQQLTGQLQVAGVPVSWAEPWLAAVNNARFDGSIALKSDWRLPLNELDSGDLKGQISGSDIALTLLDQDLDVSLQQAELNWHTDDQRRLNAQLQIHPNDIDAGINAELQLSRWAQADAGLDGQLNLKLSDLNLISAVLPQVQQAEGQANADITLAGSLQQPEIHGQFELNATQMSLPALGMQLTDVQLSAREKQTQMGDMYLQGKASSGQGVLSIDGEFSAAQQALQLTIKGQQFNVMQTPKLYVDISPDMTINYRDNALKVDGEIVVPKALVKQPDISSTASVSSDVVMVENGELVTDSSMQTPMPMDIQLRLTLGDDVRVDAFGFAGRLQGSILVNDDGKRSTTATGNINVASGAYEIYGQELNIQRGSLVYTGGSIDNPGLDLRVNRTIDSSPSAGVAAQQVEVGAQVGGTLTAPTLNLYSNPAMPDSSILSYLVLGRAPGAGGGNDNLELQAAIMLGSKGTDFVGKTLKDTFALDEVGIDSSTNDVNDTSFFIGKYLSPRLYVKYGIGLLQPTNTFFLRYHLSENWLLESTSTSEAQGGDIIYSIEVD
ncbi:translocation/assembly module TamB domain-containing protein [Idiomarina xiamenensis]|uniref:Translocation and assembly module TamB C-terminal domain-containing protein n=1 Tax=Idiomarina xiamenensis 10-D-4 TaxID=740709 RepID=K2J839_9GAMM|nr:translocation/assembly module TamB domain-containing protein [Idiomarina xiamenensis]EKE79256.1 hypothetical protein A10D4_13148 [Idiomarina xiamenensis 10-D-4]